MFGSLNNTGYSLDIDVFDVSENTNFDVMIEYGETETFTDVKTGFAKNGTSFFTDPTESGDGMLWFIGTTVDGVFATYCTGFGECLNLVMTISIFLHLDCYRPTKKLYVVTMPCKMENFHIGRIVRKETIFTKDDLLDSVLIHISRNQKEEGHRK